MIITEEG